LPCRIETICSDMNTLIQVLHSRTKHMSDKYQTGWKPGITQPRDRFEAQTVCATHH
jgi:hypothetical protein